MTYEHLGAFESTNISGSGQDVLGTTRHIQNWRNDLEMLQTAGIRQLRYPVPWHRIEKEPGKWDWQWLDGPMRFMQQAGLKPILDPLHHISFPAWLKDGFANVAFPELYCRFVTEVATRYEWVDQYTVFNEPLPTLVLCALTGDWYPYCRSEQHFVRMSFHAAQAICLVASMLRHRNKNVRLVQIDGCEHHSALDAQAISWVDHCNHRRFLFYDLALGRVDKGHPLLPYLLEHGMRNDQWRSLRDHAVPFDVMGLDYYHHSEINWIWDRENNRPVLRFPVRTRGVLLLLEWIIGNVTVCRCCFQKPTSAALYLTA